ncbi:MAG TPA: hypothetical protein VI790_06080 [Candidatus Nanoarchaeia archaeon]|nr:hypothetical protein [Candidatus Nanoarchaeia archaeon]
MIDDLLSKLPSVLVDSAKSLLKRLDVKAVSELVSVYPIVRSNFLRLRDAGAIGDYITSNGINVELFSYSSDLLSLMQAMPVVDDCNPSEVYSLLVISSQLDGGCLDLFYNLGVDGSFTENSSKKVFYPLMAPLLNFDNRASKSVVVDYWLSYLKKN